MRTIRSACPSRVSRAAIVSSLCARNPLVFRVTSLTSGLCVPLARGMFPLLTVSPRFGLACMSSWTGGSVVAVFARLAVSLWVVLFHKSVSVFCVGFLVVAADVSFCVFEVPLFSPVAVRDKLSLRVEGGLLPYAPMTLQRLPRLLVFPQSAC